MTILFASGFETGFVPFAGETLALNATLDTTAKTGSYSIRVQRTAGIETNFFVPVSSLTEYYVGAWVRWGGSTLRFVAGNIKIQNTGSGWNLYRDTTLLQGITDPVGVIDEWYNIQIYHLVDNVAGRIVVKIDGVVAFDFTGNTGVATTLIGGTDISLSVSAYFILRIDDLIIRTDTWPGDVRFVALKPSADTATKDWTPQSGSDNFAMVNNNSDASYVETDVDGHRDLYDVQNWSGSGLTAVAVVQWLRARKETADDQQVKTLLVSGATEADETFDLLTSYSGLKSTVYENDPATTSPWTNGGINAIKIGQEAIVP
jgi:hypothetical protein